MRQIFNVCRNNFSVNFTTCNFLSKNYCCQTIQNNLSLLLVDFYHKKEKLRSKNAGGEGGGGAPYPYFYKV